MFHWITKCDFGRDCDTVSAPTEEVELSDPPPTLQGRMNPARFLLFLGKKEKKDPFYFVEMFLFCKFHFYVFYNLS